MARRKQESVGTTDDDAIASDALHLYGTLLQIRDRLAGLEPVASADLEDVFHAQHELYWAIMTPPAGAASALELRPELHRDLIRAVRDRTLDVYVAAVAVTAVKLAARRRQGRSDTAQLQEIGGLLDSLTFDYRRSKREALNVLRELKLDIEARLSFVQKSTPAGYRFAAQPEQYAKRSNKREPPPAFFDRVYSAHVARGMTQADLRKADLAFYNVLHVWSVRHGRKLSQMIPSTRPKVTR